MEKTKRLTTLALLSALALGIYIAESQLPPLIPVQGVKPGLANIITLTAMCLLGRREAGVVLAVRILLGSVFAGSVSALLFSAAGGALAYAAMCALVGLFPEKQLWVVSVFAALMHNLGQLLVAVWLTRTPQVLLYGFVLLCSGIVTGAFTGLCAGALIRAGRHWLRSAPPHRARDSAAIDPAASGKRLPEREKLDGGENDT